MGLTPDDFDGPSIEEETQYDDRGPGGDNTGDPTVAGALRRVTNALRFFVGGAVRQVIQAKNPPAGFDDFDLTGVVGGDLLEYDATLKHFKPGAGGGGLTAGSHRPLDQLVHGIAENSFEEINKTGNKVDSIIVWTTAGKTQKIREEIFTYTGSKITTIVTKQYDGAGVLVAGETMTETLSYTGANLDDITRVMS
jgi:hypothetical protein